MQADLVIAILGGAVLLTSAVSLLLQRASLPAPLVTLAIGALAGPSVLGLLDVAALGLDTNTVLEEAARVTLAIGLAGVALRLPHGYWRQNVRWIASAVGAGMVLMTVVATGVLWLSLGAGLLVALLIGAILTPTDPIVTTPIVTGTLARRNIPSRLRYDISSESGLNDGLGYPFVLLPVLLLTRPAGEAWTTLLVDTVVHQVLGALAVGVVTGWALGRIYVTAHRRGLMESTTYLGFIVPLALTVLGVSRLLGTDGVLAVFVACAVFGQIVPEADREQEGTIDDVVSRFLTLPVFVLIGAVLPFAAWADLGWPAVAGVIAALLLRRFVAIWAIRPLIARLHDRRETLFLSWFGPIGVSALLYATIAVDRTGNENVLTITLLAITSSVVIHGVTATPFSRWLGSVEQTSGEK